MEKYNDASISFYLSNKFKIKYINKMYQIENKDKVRGIKMLKICYLKRATKQRTFCMIDQESKRRYKDID